MMIGIINNSLSGGTRRMDVFESETRNLEFSRASAMLKNVFDLEHRKHILGN